MYNHSPELSLANVASTFANTASTVTTTTTGVEVPAGSLVAVTCQMQANSASAGTITLTASAGGFGTQTYTDFQSNGADGACHSLLVFTVPNTMPAGTTLTYTRSTNWANAELRMILCTGCTRLANRFNFSGTVAGSGLIVNDLLFNSGTVNVPHFIKSGINITLGSANSRQNITGIGFGGQVPYTGPGMIAVQGGAGTAVIGSGFQYLVATTIWRLAAPNTTQRFAAAIGAANQQWICTQYRLTPG